MPGRQRTAVLRADRFEEHLHFADLHSEPHLPLMGRKACHVHDQANLLVLPVLSILSVGGLLGLADPYLVTNLFLVYIVADFIWLCVIPEAIPSLHIVVLIHHVVTFLLLLFPFFKPEYSIYACLDGLTEINTAFVVARRFFRARHLRAICTAGHWITFFPLRFVLYPVLVFKFWQVLEHEPLPYRLWMSGSQLALCCFNCLFLHAILTRHKVYSSLASAFSSEQDFQQKR